MRSVETAVSPIKFCIFYGADHQESLEPPPPPSPPPPLKSEPELEDELSEEDEDHESLELEGVTQVSPGE
jgi:hypothetical protein